MSRELVGECVLVAGASRGIGLGIARAVAAAGADVVLVARSEAELSAAADRIRGDFPSCEVFAIDADLTQWRSGAAVIDRCTEAGHLPTAVVLNVGSGQGDNGTCLGEDEWARVFAQNLWSGVALAESAIGVFQRQQCGRLLFISSIVGVEDVGAPIPYSVAKAALNHYVVTLARRVGGDGITVNAIVPGNVLFEGGSWERKLEADAATWQQYIKREVALARFGTVDDVAAAAVFLLSGGAGFITGALVRVDGGQCRST